MLTVDNHGDKSYLNLPQEWQGTAIACRFNTKTLPSDFGKLTDPEVDRIVDQLRVEL